MADLEIPRVRPAQSFALFHDSDPCPPVQPIGAEKSSAFVDSIWEVPTILESNRVKSYVRLSNLPALGYRAYRIAPEALAPRNPATPVTGPSSMENDLLKVTVNGNGTVSVVHKPTGRAYENLNYLSDEGVQCPGVQRFEYGLTFHEGAWSDAGVLERAAGLFTPVRAVMSGRGKGSLALEGTLCAVDGKPIAVACVKEAEDGSGLIVRLFNPVEEDHDAESSEASWADAPPMRALSRQKLPIVP